MLHAFLNSGGLSRGRPVHLALSHQESCMLLQHWWPWDRHAYGLHYDIEVDLRKHAGRYRVVRQVSVQVTLALVSEPV